MAASLVWIHMLPALAYTIEPSNAASSGTTTSFEGAGVRAGPATFPPSPVDPPMPNGTSPLSRFSVMTPMSTRPMTESRGARIVPIGPHAVRIARPRRARSCRPCHEAAPTRPGADAAARTTAASGWAPLGQRPGSRAGATRTRRTSGCVSRATTSMTSPSWTGPAMSGRPKAMPSSTSRSPRRVSDVWSAPACADPRDGQPEDRNERLGIARAVRGERGELALQAVVDVQGRHGDVDRQDRPRIRWRPTPRRSPRTARRTRATDRPAARTRPPRRGRRSA